jgi:hypothetical protein
LEIPTWSKEGLDNMVGGTAVLNPNPKEDILISGNILV